MLLGLSEFTTTSRYPCCPVLKLFDEFRDEEYSAGPLGELLYSLNLCDVVTFISCKDSQTLSESLRIASLIGFL